MTYDEQKEYEQKIMDKWLRDTNPGMPFLEFCNSKSNIEATPTGKCYIRKSKWKLVNLWRKLTNTEVKEEEYSYKWKNPVDKTTDI